MQTPPEKYDFEGHGVQCIFKELTIRITCNFGQITLNKEQADYLSQIINWGIKEGAFDEYV